VCQIRGQDSSGKEEDAIVQKYNGDWCAFKNKLGAVPIEVAANRLKKLVSILNAEIVRILKLSNFIEDTRLS
jgi:hypothetical protein